MKKIWQKINYPMIIYLLICFIQLLIISKLTDLPVTIGNWMEKSETISKFKPPKSNFYPPGSAIMLLPFIWLKRNLFVVIVIYYLGSATIFYLLSQRIKKMKVRRILLSVFPLNPYLSWLCITSQDTVFELFLCLLFIEFGIRKRYYHLSVCGLLLCLTRPSYWPTFLAFSIFLILKNINSNKYLILKSMIPIFLLPVILLINHATYNSLSLAGESGKTLYFSYNQYHYLSLPLFDMDVFLSKGGHMEPINGDDSSSNFSRMAFNSIQHHPKETVLGWMQKVDSYIFDVQKVPHLPGEYFLSENKKSIIIGDERLYWPIVLGNLIYEIYRSIWLILLISCIGILLTIKILKNTSLQNKDSMVLLSIPWFCGLIPGVMFYTETRFKIVSELVLSVFIGLVYDNLVIDKIEKNNHEVQGA